jgi:hypothetical protein
MIGIIALFIGSTAQAQSCDEVAAPGAQVQIAWVSPLRKTVGARGWIEVVRVSDLRTWVRDHEEDTTRVLQVLGVKGRRARAVDAQDYKITLFDVDAAWLCRPIDGGTPGEPHQGVSICEEPQQDSLWAHRRGYSGCGYSLDTGASVRGLDVYRIRWSEASAWGFCVMPMERFIKGA